MAIEKSHTISNGATGNHWEITSIRVNVRTRDVFYVLELFKDASFFPAGRSLGELKEFIFNLTELEMQGDLLDIGEDKILAANDPDLDGAVAL